MNIIVEINNLTKTYGRIVALDDVSLQVPQGVVYGILGPNGSGKTTLLGLLLTILRPDKGSIRIFGEPPTAKGRQKIGTLLETPNFYHYLSAWQNLRIAAKIKQVNHPDYEGVLRQTGLWERRQSPFSSYSLGMKQRLAIASCLLGDPEVMIFDEPTNGLDPKGIAEIRQLIVNLAHEGRTIIMASHLLDEVEKVCSHVAILKQGKLMATGHVDEILHQDQLVELGSENSAQLREAMAQYPGVKIIDLTAKDIFTVSITNENADLGKINQYCFENGVILNRLVRKKQSLESKFIEITN